MIAKLIVHGPDRAAAISSMSRALAGFTVGGVHTTIPFHQAVLAHPDFGKGLITTSWVEESFMKQGFEKERVA
jgi:acetyl-CoA carboxylase biotin carboxylase subunit